MLKPYWKRHIVVHVQQRYCLNRCHLWKFICSGGSTICYRELLVIGQIYVCGYAISHQSILAMVTFSC
jgi:hypothetical protein